MAEGAASAGAHNLGLTRDPQDREPNPPSPFRPASAGTHVRVPALATPRSRTRSTTPDGAPSHPRPHSHPRLPHTFGPSTVARSPIRSDAGRRLDRAHEEPS
jgi:hypothetical protein